ncbi:hypothetical protein DFJ74DRAFT_711239 [Hyaloraphidium curvatum]|nr:hypothetical protein DFJ74DRAFT_711239 [Hyaloraphidium curvatum]
MPGAGPVLPVELLDAVLLPLAGSDDAHRLWALRRVSRAFHAVCGRLLLRAVRGLLRTRRGARLSCLLIALRELENMGWARVGLLLAEAADPERARGERTPHPAPAREPGGPASGLLLPFLVSFASHLAIAELPMAAVAPLLDQLALHPLDLAWLLEELPADEDDRVPPLGALLAAMRLTPHVRRWVVWKGLEDEAAWWDPSARFLLLCHAMGWFRGDATWGPAAEELVSIAVHGPELVRGAVRTNGSSPLPAYPKPGMPFSLHGLDWAGQIITSPKLPRDLVPAFAARLYEAAGASPDPVRTSRNRRALFRAIGMRPVNPDWGDRLSAEVVLAIAAGNGRRAASAIEELCYEGEGPAPDEVPTVLATFFAPVPREGKAAFVAETLAKLSWTALRRRLFTTIEAVFVFGGGAAEVEADGNVAASSFPEFLGHVFRHMLRASTYRIDHLAEAADRLVNMHRAEQEHESAEELATLLLALGWLDDADEQLAAPDGGDVADEQVAGYEDLAFLLFERLRSSAATPTLLGRTFALLTGKHLGSKWQIEDIYSPDPAPLPDAAHLLPLRGLHRLASSSCRLAAHLPLVGVTRAFLRRSPELARRMLSPFWASFFASMSENGFISIAPGQAVADAPPWASLLLPAARALLPPPQRAQLLCPLFRNPEPTAALIARVAVACGARDEAAVRAVARQMGAGRSSTREGNAVRAARGLWAAERAAIGGEAGVPDEAESGKGRMEGAMRAE